MANNRLYLRCKHCREEIYIDKNYGGPYLISEERLKEINQFFEDHAFCGPKHEMADGGWFELYDETHSED